jgi:hypothetical protein
LIGNSSALGGYQVAQPQIDVTADCVELFGSVNDNLSRAKIEWNVCGRRLRQQKHAGLD